MKTHAILTLMALSPASLAGTVGLWRFDEASAAAGGSLETAENLVSPGTLDALISNGSPLYSDDVPAGEIFDPISGQTYTNGFSFDASGGNAQLLTDNSPDLDSSFTVEFFVKYVGEPASYESIFRRQEFLDLSWQVDFDHAANAGFGRIRTRWDTPGGEPNGVVETGVDENTNFVLGPQGGANAFKVYIDTGAKDDLGADVGPQNTGNPADYIFDAASLNPSETDVALQGDGINDVPEWHHVALTLDQETGEVKFYVDYLLAQTRTLSDSEGDGYTHPAAGLVFGKLSSTEYGLLLDEVRYSDAVLSPGEFLREPSDASAASIAYWRMEEESAAEGMEIFSVANTISDSHSATAAAGTPLYSADVPSTLIYDPISDTTYGNNFSMDATNGNSRLGVANDEAFDTSFTLEFFIKLTGEPAGYESFLRRQQTSDLRWQIDFDHANAGAYGRLRSRWDTPAGEPDNVAEVGVDENVNFVLGAIGGANIPDALRLFIDTDAGDGMVSSYDDPSDWALDGDGLNDNPIWHHAAITFDEETGVVGYYFDYELLQNRTLSDSEGDGYTHPAADIVFGKLSSGDYGLFLDEIRYSGKVLFSYEFLQPVEIPDVALQITEVAYDSATSSATVTWTSVAGRKYSLDYSLSLEEGSWFEILEEEAAGGETQSYIDSEQPKSASKIFYRVREIE